MIPWLAAGLVLLMAGALVLGTPWRDDSEPPPGRQDDGTESLRDRGIRDPHLVGSTDAVVERPGPGALPTGVPRDDANTSGSATAPRPLLRFVGSGERPDTVTLDIAPDGRWDDTVRLTVQGGAQPPSLTPAKLYTVWVRALDSWPSDQGRADDLPVGEGGWVEVVVRLPGRPGLEVVDTASGQPVAGASVLRMVGTERFVEDTPSPTKKTLTRGEEFRCDRDGRLAFPMTTRVRGWWVGAPGRRWTRATTSPEIPFQRVALAAGGSIRAEVVTSSDLDPYEVFALSEKEARWRTGGWTAGAWLRPTPDAPDQFSVEGLAPGRWRVVLGPPGGFTLREVWAAADVDVAADVPSYVKLVVSPREQSARHTLNGTLRVPEAWSEPTTHMWISGQEPRNGAVEAMVQLEGLDLRDPVPFHFADLVPGLYLIKVYPQEWSRLVYVPEEARDLFLEVPAPREVRVRVVDDADGKPIDASEVTIHLPVEQSTARAAPANDAEEEPFPGELPLAYQEGGYVGTIRRTAEGPHVAQVPEGCTVLVRTSATGFFDVLTEVRAEPHEEIGVLVVRLRRAGVICVRVVRDGEVVATARGEVQCLTVKGEWLGYRSRELRDGTATFGDLEAGAYRIRLPDDVAESPAEEVEVQEGQTVNVDVKAR